MQTLQTLESHHDERERGERGEHAEVGADAGAGTARLRHVAIIPDGNRRWAQRRGLRAEDGHAHGFLMVTPMLLDALWSRGVKETTLWMFSTDNWKRSAGEIAHLMDIFTRFVERMLPMACTRCVRVRHLGRRDRLPGELLARLEDIQERTRAMDRYAFNIALDHGGKDEIVRLIQRLLRDRVAPEAVDEHTLDALLGAGQPPHTSPDLVIRTSGELRLSGFLPFHSGHSELYFTNVLYPDLTPAGIARAIDAYQARQRRFGR